MASAQVEERQLLKAMTWWDGFVVALANPGFLIAALGGSIGALGTAGAFVLWSISITLGALQNNIHAELASMFPNKSGGIALYAHEAWRKYLTIIGPLATFGYWIGWSVVLVDQRARGRHADPGGVVLRHDVDARAAAGFDLDLPIVHRHRPDRARLAVQHLRGPAGRLVRLRDRRRCCCIPAFVLMFLPYITGDWSSSNMTVGHRGQRRARARLVWLYFMCWSAYGIEVVATFAPEYHDTQRDTRMALRTAALFSVAVYVLLPLGARRHARHRGDRRGRRR